MRTNASSSLQNGLKSSIATLQCLLLSAALQQRSSLSMINCVMQLFHFLALHLAPNINLNQQITDFSFEVKPTFRYELSGDSDRSQTF